MALNNLPLNEFFNRVSELLDNSHSRGHGTIFLTQKRLSRWPLELNDKHGPGQTERETKIVPTACFPEEPLIFRVTNGKSRTTGSEKIKLSTIVLPEDLAAFYARYSEICKSGMRGLKKRDRSSRKKAKAKKRKDAEAGKAM